MKKILILLFATSLLMACNSNKKVDDKPEETTQETVTKYAYQRAFTTLEWTAYKTTAKVGVKGSFDEFNITPGQEEGSALEIMNQMSFSIPVSTTNSGNEERDPKIIESFFGVMMNTKTITGQFVSVNGNDSVGTIRIRIKMNDVENEIDGNYTINGNEVSVKATMNLADWKAESSVTALNEVCSDLHKGDDGSSILWPDVDIAIVSKLKPIRTATAQSAE